MKFPAYGRVHLPFCMGLATFGHVYLPFCMKFPVYGRIHLPFCMGLTTFGHIYLPFCMGFATCGRVHLPFCMGFITCGRVHLPFCMDFFRCGYIYLPFCIGFATCWYIHLPFCMEFFRCGCLYHIIISTPKEFDIFWHDHLQYIIMSFPSCQEKVNSQKYMLCIIIMVRIHTIIFTTSLYQPPRNLIYFGMTTFITLLCHPQAIKRRLIHKNTNYGQ